MENEPNSLHKYKQAFQILSPDEDGKVHRDMLKNFLANNLGSHFGEETVKNIIDNMKPDVNGMISVDGFMEAFSLNHWTAETLSAMYDILENSPDLVEGLADWKSILTNLGLNISEENVGQLIGQARKCAADLLSLQLKKEPQLDKSEVGTKNSQILRALQEKLHLLDIGGGVALPQKSPEEEPPSESRD